MKKPGAARKYDELLSCEVRIYFTQSQFDLLLTALGTSQTASAYLRNMFLTSFDPAFLTDSTTYPLIKPLDCPDNEHDSA